MNGEKIMNFIRIFAITSVLGAALSTHISLCAMKQPYDDADDRP